MPSAPGNKRIEITENQHNALRTLATIYGTTPQALVRAAVGDYLCRCEQNSIFRQGKTLRWIEVEARADAWAWVAVRSAGPLVGRSYRSAGEVPTHPSPSGRGGVGLVER